VQPRPEDPGTPPGDDPRAGVTAGGYRYEVVDDTEQRVHRPRALRIRAPRIARRPGGAPRTWSSPVVLWAVGLTLVIGAVVGWFAASFAGDGGANDARTTANVGSVINAFTRQEDAVSTRFEGALPPSFPSELPVYPHARIVSAVQHVRDGDVSYLVAYDAADRRADVSAFYGDALSGDPWQIDAVQDGIDSSVHQFSRIDDANVEGFVLAAESKDDRITTILVSLRIIAGAPDDGGEPFDAGAGKPLPEGFPAEDVPVYPGATVIESILQREPGAESFSISAVTRDGIDEVLTFYEDEFADAGWLVQPAGNGGSTLEDAEAVQFSAADGSVQGLLTAGVLAEDDTYTRIEIQVRTTN
jgi:hypothetical protein